MTTATLERTPKNATPLVDALDGRRARPQPVGGPSHLEGVWAAAHRREVGKLSCDPRFVAKVRDAVGLHLDPPERAVVLRVDEKSQIQALDRAAPILPMLPGVPERATHDNRRSRASSLYAALDLASDG